MRRRIASGVVPLVAVVLLLLPGCGRPGDQAQNTEGSSSPLLEEPVAAEAGESSPSPVGSHPGGSGVGSTAQPVGQPSEWVPDDLLEMFETLPQGVNPVGIVEALGGHLSEGSAAEYPAIYVDACWDGLTRTYYLYVTDEADVDVSSIAEHLGGQSLEVVGVEFDRESLLTWERELNRSLEAASISGYANILVVSPEWPSGHQFCSPSGPFLMVNVFDRLDEVDLDLLLDGIPRDLVVVEVAAQSQVLPGGSDPSG